MSESHGIAVQSDEGKSVWFMGDLYTLKLTGDHTGGSYSLTEITIYPQNGPPPHIHLREDEAFYILKGNFSFLCGERKLKLTAGAFVHIPKGTIHTFQNVGTSPGRMLVLVTPSGLEKFFEAMGQPVTDKSATPPPPTAADIERLKALAPKYHLEIREPSAG